MPPRCAVTLDRRVHVPRLTPHNPRNTEVIQMRKLASVTVLAGFIASLALPALAQTTTPMGPQDCKTTEKWDAATKSCKPSG